MNKYSAIIFDMNGVIVDDEPLHLQADILACTEFGITVPTEAWFAYKGWKAEDIFADIVERFSASPQDVSKILASKIEHYFKLADERLLLVDGVLDLIKLFKNKHYKIALATSSYKVVQEYVFKRFDLASYFDEIVTAEDIKKGKPDPAAYLAAATKLSVAPTECLVIEDSINGIVSGKAAGCQVLSVPTTFPMSELSSVGADFVFTNFAEAVINQNIWLK